MDDRQLLREYVVSHSEAAFRTLVERYIRLVYGAALRQLDNSSQAEDVTQAVFIILARKAPALPAETILSGWLYRATRFTADKARRSEYRRQQREHEAVQMQTGVNDSDWSRLAPVLDGAMAHLQEGDRTAILLRFFENKSLRDVGHALGISEDSAQKRVSRAIDKLRGLLAKEGVMVSSAAMTSGISAHAMPIVPAQTGTTVAAVGLGHQAVSAGVLRLAKTMQFGGPRPGIVAGSLAAFLFLTIGLLFLQPLLGHHSTRSLLAALTSALTTNSASTPTVATNRPAPEPMAVASPGLQTKPQTLTSLPKTARTSNVRVKVPGVAPTPAASGLAAIRLSLTGTPGLRFDLIYSHDGETQTISGVLPDEVSFQADTFTASITIHDAGQFGFDIYRNDRLAAWRPTSDVDANCILLIEALPRGRGFRFSVK